MDRFPRTPRAASRFFPFQGARLHYLDMGQGEPTAVFVHGFACSHEFWAGEALRLAQSRRVLALDLPGHGRSDPAPWGRYDLGLFGDALASLLGHANAGRTCLIGHSMGVAVALEAAHHEPEAMAGLCLVDGGVPSLQSRPSERQEARRRLAERLVELSDLEFQVFFRSWIEAMFKAETPAGLRREVLTRMTATPRSVVQSMFGRLDAPSQWRAEPFEVPTLAVYASARLPPRGMETLFPRLTWRCWPEAGHFLMLERPEAFHELLEPFLAKIR